MVSVLCGLACVISESDCGAFAQAIPAGGEPMSIGNSNAVEFSNEEQQPSIQSREFSLWSAVLLVAN
jgi:hypothetical protein